MARQFEVFEQRRGTLFVLVQSNLLDDLDTRVVIPLRKPESGGVLLKHLNPIVVFSGASYVLQTNLLVAVPVHRLGTIIGSLEKERDRIVRALDVLITGV